MSSKRFRLGLVVGKFAPLHRGHELVIRRALEQCERVAIVSWSRPELPGCGPERRERWLAALFPETARLVVTPERLRAWLPREASLPEVPRNDAPDEAHREFVGYLCLRVLGAAVDAVFTSESYGDGLAAHLTRYFHRRDPAARAVAHVPVDRDRRLVPISGSALRADVHAGRAWLSPVVYSSFVERVCTLGGESSGKSTLAAALAGALGTVHVAEYGRELWEAKNGALAFEDLLHIGLEQTAREREAAGRARRWVFCDTSPLTTMFYSEHLFGKIDPRLAALADRRYHLCVLCAPDFAFIQDGTRQDERFRERQHAWYLEELGRRGWPYVLASGGVEERVALVSAALWRG